MMQHAPQMNNGIDMSGFGVTGMPPQGLMPNMGMGM